MDRPRATDDPIPSASGRRFRFEFAAPYRPAALAFGVRDANAWVTVDDGHLLARFGPWTVRTPLTNIVTAEPSGPFAFVKTAGPARLTLSNRGLTFATTGRQGLLVRFLEPVRGLDPFGIVRHPDLTVTVVDRDALAAALTAPAAVPGERTRRDR